MIRILLVDDEPDLLDLERRILEQKYGFLTVTAESGKEALEIFQSQQIDAIISDYSMPLMDGIPARLFRKRGVCLNISCIGRGDVNQFFSAHFAAPTACTTVRVVLTADCAA